jgi:hypothetical protein
MTGPSAAQPGFPRTFRREGNRLSLPGAAPVGKTRLDRLSGKSRNINSVLSYTGLPRWAESSLLLSGRAGSS